MTDSFLKYCKARKELEEKVEEENEELKEATSFAEEQIQQDKLRHKKKEKLTFPRYYTKNGCTLVKEKKNLATYGKMV